MREGFEEFAISYTEAEKQETLERLASILRDEGVEIQIECPQMSDRGKRHIDRVADIMLIMSAHVLDAAVSTP